MPRHLKKLAQNITHMVKRRPAFLIAEILLTYHCTQRCLQCNIPQRASAGNVITTKNFQLILQRLAAYGTHGIVLSGGEPLLHPQIETLIEHTAGKGFLYRHMLSNLYIDKAKIKRITPLLLNHKINLTCSFDGLDGTADLIRGSKHTAQTVMANMEYLDAQNKKMGRPIKTSANIVISALNLEQIPATLDYLEQLGWMTNVDIYRNSSANHNQVDAMVVENNGLFQCIIDRVKASPVVVTSLWILDGYRNYLEGDFAKNCPYLSSPALGSKFYIHPNGEVRVCIGEAAGNLLKQVPEQIFASETWQNKKKEFEECRGCWNTCYTPAAKISNYLTWRDVKNILHIVKK